MLLLSNLDVFFSYPATSSAGRKLAITAVVSLSAFHSYLLLNVYSIVFFLQKIISKASTD
jgi:hypothetical protein